MDEAKGNGNDSSDEMVGIEDEELRAQIKAQLVSATPIFDSNGLTALHRVAESGLGGGGVVARLLAACPVLMDSVSQCGGKEEESDPLNPAAAYASRTALHGAARNGHAAIVGQLLAVNPASIETRTEEGFTVLHCAARGGHTAIVSQLLAANPALVEHDNGETAFHCAARGGHAAIMTLLMTVSPASVEARMNATAQSESEAKWRSEMDGIKDGDLRAQIRAQLLSEVPLPDSPTALCLAAKRGLGEVVTRLLAVCPGLLDADFTAKDSDTGLAKLASGPLHHAAREGHTAIVTQLLAVNPNLAEARDLSGGTALHEAARNGHAATVAQLMAVNPVLIEARDKYGFTVLHCAAKEREVDPAVVSLLLAAKPALVDARDNSGCTVLHHAVESGNAAIVAQVLAANPALIDVTANRGRTAFEDAAFGGHAAIMTQLLAANPGLAHSSSSDRVFFGAIGGGHLEIVTQLLAANPALIDAKGDFFNGANVLQYAALSMKQSGSEALIAQLLAAKPALIEEKSQNGRTALHWAVQSGQAERVAQLLAAKASIEARTNDGQTALHYAVIDKYPEIVTQLLAAQPALIEARMDDGKTVLHCALGHDEITAQLLAAHPALLDAITNDTDSWAALLNVIQIGHEEAVSRCMHPELIHQTSPDYGWTVFHFAASYGRDKVMSRLLASVVSQPDLGQLLLRRSTADDPHHDIWQCLTALQVVVATKPTDLTH